MATQTTRLLLRKPDPNPTTGDFIDVVTDINNSMDKLDATAGYTICTSGTRPTGTDRWDGREIYETDTRRNYLWSAAVSDWLPLLVGRSATGPYLVGPSVDTSGIGFNFQGASGDDIIRSRVTSDANPRFVLDNVGRLEWGPGSAGVDTNLYRSAASILKTDDTFYAAGGLQVGANASGVLLKIDEVILGATQATITLPVSGSIPSTFKSLLILGTAVGTTAASFTQVGMRMNGVSTATYDSQQILGNAASALAGETINGTSGSVGEMAAASATAGSAGSYEIKIPFYAGTTFWKNYVSQHILSAGTGTGSVHSKQWTGRLRSTSAVTSVTFVPAAGSFGAGTSFTLYGLP